MSNLSIIPYQCFGYRKTLEQQRLKYKEARIDRLADEAGPMWLALSG